MDLKGFRDKVRYYRRLSGYSQQALAEEIGLYPTVLSAKLNGNDPAHLLTHPEIKRIILTLAHWEAITQKSQVKELLELAKLKLSAFTDQEWKSPPLNQLEASPLWPVVPPSTTSPAKTRSESAAKLSPSTHDSSIVPLPLNPNGQSIPASIQEQTSVSEPVSLDAAFTSSLAKTLKLSASPPPTNLPAQLTSFVGRSEETSAICAILQNPEVRLLTLSGPGGTGKTRLALHLAKNLQDFFPDGVFFVGLAVITDAKLVVPSIAQVLGIKDGDETTLTHLLVNYLRERQLLLVLDNFEQVLEAGPAIAQLLENAAKVKIVVTSRSSLQLYGEHEYPVQPLALPPASAYLTLLQAYSAVQLFVQRARAIRPDFSLNEENAKAVVEICARLDGLPLAIELAAARCRLLTPQAMLPQLNKRLALVTGGPRNLPQRQQTLRGTIEWSYNLLTAQEQQIFAKLGVFVGGFTLEAAEGICSEGTSLFEIIMTLTEKNLLKQIQSAEAELPRFSMLETIREYAREQLEKSQTFREVQQAHLTYFLNWVEELEPQLHGFEQTRWANLLELEHDNLRAALQFSLAEEKVELASRLGLGLNWFWYIHSHVTEGRRWLHKILSLASKSGDSVQAALLRVAGQLAHVQGDYQHSIPLLEQSIDQYRQLGDSLNLALALRMRGVSALNTSDYTKALALLEEALRLFRKLDHQWGITMTLTRLGQLRYEQGQFDIVRQLLNEAVEVAQSQGDKAALGYAELGLGWLELALGNYEPVQALADSGLGRAQSLGDQNLIAWNLWNKAGASLGQGLYLAAHTFAVQSYNIWLSIDDKMGLALSLTRQGAIAAAQRQFSKAQGLYRRALKLWYEQKSLLFFAICLEGLALVAKGQNQLKQMVCLWSSAVHLRELAGTPLAPTELEIYQEINAMVGSELADQVSGASWAEISLADLTDLLNYALHQSGINFNEL
jgi:predicted ATPase/transcriptional regulator with XRE-family HTH domain